jgi:hypothetical protein
MLLISIFSDPDLAETPPPILRRSFQNNTCKTPYFAPKMYERYSFRMYSSFWIPYCDPCTCLTVIISRIIKCRGNLYQELRSSLSKYYCGFVLS